MNLPQSTLVYDQKIFFEKETNEGKVKVHIRYDDECGNGHNSFSMVACAYNWSCPAGHPSTDKLFRTYFPHLQKYRKWHLCSSDGPIHYIENTIYWAKVPNLKNARSCAIWPDATLQELKSPAALLMRLPRLLEEFKRDMQELFGSTLTY